jgi:hypothetical protein
MMAKFRSPLFLGALILVLAGCGVLYALGGGDEAVNWVESAIRNWQQYGFWALHGKMVTNPGGYEVLTKPEIYQGHRPASMYPVFVIEQLLTWAGPGNLPFQIAFSLILFVSVGWLMRASRWAWLAAVVVLFCPGYTVYPAHLDPNAIALYMAVPFLALLLALLRRPRLGQLQAVLVCLLVFCYTQLNWTTIFGHGMVLAFLLLERSISWKRLGLYVAAAGVSLGLVATVSVLDKMGHGAAASSSTSSGSGLAMLGNYTWGTSGYGAGQTTVKAFTRIGATNTAGLLPLWLLVGFCFFRGCKTGWARRQLALLPLAVAVIPLLVMRNYFGNHPWMATPLLLPGAVLALCLLARQGNSAGAEVDAGGRDSDFA